MSSRSSRALRARNARRSRVDRSAQWRSSITRRIGARLAEPAEEPKDPFEDPGLEPFRSGRPARASPSATGQLGTSRASSGRLGPAAAAIRSRSTSRTSDAQRLDDRPERQAVVAERHRAAFEDEPAAIATAGAELGHEAALADARLAADERQRGVSGRGDIGRGEEGHTSFDRPTNTGLDSRRAMPRDDTARDWRPSRTDRADGTDGPDRRQAPATGQAPRRRRAAWSSADGRGLMWPAPSGLAQDRAKAVMPPRTRPGAASPPSRAARSRARWADRALVILLDHPDVGFRVHVHGGAPRVVRPRGWRSLRTR